MYIIHLVINRLFITLFTTNDIDVVKYCQCCFGFETPSELWEKHVNKLNQKIDKYVHENSANNIIS